MVFIDEKGRLFGLVNLLDLAVFCFILILVASLFLYSRYPLQLKEHRDVIFQMYFPYNLEAIQQHKALAQQIFVPGAPLVATYSRDDTAVIIDMKEFLFDVTYVNEYYNATAFLVTINGSLEVDAEGDILFNGNDVAPGNQFDVQIGSSYLSGQVWRVDYQHFIQLIKIKVKIEDFQQLDITSGHIVFDTTGHVIGDYITSIEEDGKYYLILSLQADVYDGDIFVSEMPIQHFAPFYFWLDNIFYEGTIVEVSQ